MRFEPLILGLPDWAELRLPPEGTVLETPEDRMALAVALSRESVQHGGGPFGAVVFERDTGILIAAGVNQVELAGGSLAHAEMVALSLAQRKLGDYDLGGPGLPACELVSSNEPCAMCIGAIPWSGVRRLVCGARDADAREAGFDEGLKPPNWREHFESIGIAVVCDVLRAEAREVLMAFARSDREAYNSRRGDAPDAGSH
jgi:tRNA(Arg) A34 adenosine deaminase TadA